MNARLLHCLFLSASLVSPVLAEQPIQLNAAWEEEHPGRLQYAGGTAMGGRNDYLFRLRLDKPALVTIIHETADPEAETPSWARRVRTTTMEATDDVRFGVTTYPPHELRHRFRLIAFRSSHEGQSMLEWEKDQTYHLDVQEVGRQLSLLDVISYE